MPPASALIVVGLSAVLAGCAAAPTEAPAPPDPVVQPAQDGAAGGGTGAENQGAALEPWLPDPDAVLPRAPLRLAERLTRTTRALFAAIDRWHASGRTDHWPPPRAVAVLALDLQRSVQTLAGAPGRREATIAALPPALRPPVRDAAEAGATLLAGMGPVTATEPITMRTRAPSPPDVLLGYYREAARRFDVPWTLLAAVHFLETKFGRVISNSWAGAQGPMQFLPSTWEAYGLGGDIRDTRDAIHGAANYLSANGAPHDLRGALWAYNPVAYYGEAVLRYERQMRRDQRMFYAFYSWQVFVRTADGSVQLTGPGADIRSST
jgi:soluble lytic murein transglycosylase-like protein